VFLNTWSELSRKETIFFEVEALISSSVVSIIVLHIFIVRKIMFESKDYHLFIDFEASQGGSVDADIIEIGITCDPRINSEAHFHEFVKTKQKLSSFSKFLILSPPQTAELGTAAPDIIFLEIFCAPELHNIYVVQYRYCSMAIARYYTSK
jgi:hypothetical protein